MKNKFLLIVVCFIMFTCNNNEPEVAPQGYIAFTFSVADASSGRTSTVIADAADITITNTSGEVVYNDVVSITTHNNGYASEQLLLPVAHYKLTKFILLEANQAKYAAPVSGSEMASLVDSPLSNNFTIEQGEVTTLSPEVVRIYYASPVAFGYTTFGFEVAAGEAPEGFQSFIVTTSVAATGTANEPVNGILQVSSKNSAGTVIWRHKWDIAKTKTINVAKADRYAFQFSKPGYITHSQFYKSSDLADVDNLSFELIPQNSSDFMVKSFGDGQIKMYLPTDRAKVYARMDIAEDFVYDYLYTDRSASAVSQVPLADLLYAEVFEPSELARLCVNLFNNTPYAQATDLRDKVDMTKALWTKDFARDVVVSSYTVVSYPQGTQYEFEDDYYTWNFNRKAFYVYWCNATHDELMCRIASE